jgi:hypothetical protein
VSSAGTRSGHAGTETSSYRSWHLTCQVGPVPRCPT